MPQGDCSQEASLGPIGSFSSPQPISDLGSLRFSEFDCGEPSLNEWLAKRAKKSEGQSSRTYVILNSGDVAAYYCLSAGSASLRSFPSRIRRNMPDPIPVTVLGRLAVDKRFQALGLGTDILRHSFIQTLSASAIIGCRALVVHCLNEKAKAFYVKAEFLPFGESQMTVFLPIEKIRKLFLDN